MQENNLNLEQSLTQNKGVQTDIWSAFRYADDAVSALNPFALDPEEEARRHRIAQHKASPRSGHIKPLMLESALEISKQGRLSRSEQSKEECEKIKQKIKEFLAVELKLELSEEKTLITHSANYARFLGYDIRVRRNNQIKRDSRGFSKRTLSNIVELCVPLKDKIERYLFDNDIVEQVNGELRSKKRNALIRFTDLEILTIYNAELRGICNYYCMASNFNALHYFAYLMEYSCLKTLAGKHKSKISKIKRKYRDGQGNWSIPFL